MSTAQKTPLSRTLNQFARDKALSEIRKRGMALPGKVLSVSGPIVTVNFEVSGATLPVVSMPLAWPEYVRLPIQAGDLGAAFPLDTSLAVIAGLGTTPAALDILQGNLSTLVWVPVANKNWSAVDTNAVTIYGPNGVVLRDTTGASVVTLTPTEISMAVGGHTVLINSTGVIIDGKVFLTHNHVPGTYNVGGTAVTGDSGAVV